MPTPLSRGRSQAAIAVLAAAVSACGGASPPHIDLIGVEPGELIASSDAQHDLFISLVYRDADADLMGGKIRLLDRRTLSQASPDVTELTLPSGPGAAGLTEGILRVRMNRITVFAQDGEALRYEVTVFDRAGHSSNTILTTPVVVRP